MTNLKPKNPRSYINLKAKSPLKAWDFDSLFSHISQKKKEYILRNPEMTLSEKKYLKLINLEKKRLANWPLAYLIKEQGFYNIKLKVSGAVLIPRPETEILVDFVIKKVLLKDKKEKINIIDIGSGSGAIIISLAKNLSKIKNTSFYASDISASALRLAKENAKSYRLNKKIEFKLADLIKPWEKTLKQIFENEEEIIITANLPYLKPEEMKELSLEKEPSLALLSGKDGLKHYRQLFSQLSSFTKKYKKENKNKVLIICEINPKQAQDFKKIVEKNFSNAKIELMKDLRKKTRFVLVYLR